MSSYKNFQVRLLRRGRVFHFVSYEARLPNPRTGDPGLPPTWFLMSAGKRWPVCAHVVDQDPQEVIATLSRWLDQQVFTTRSA